MGEARRRRERLQGLKEFHKQTREGGFGPTGGAMECTIVRGPEMISTKHMTHAMQLGKLIFENKPGQGPLCFACEHEFTRDKPPPAAMAVTVPIHPAPDRVIITGICDQCCNRSDEELTRVAHAGLKKIGLAGDLAMPVHGSH